jgi:hypothetical protein
VQTESWFRNLGVVASSGSGIKNDWAGENQHQFTRNRGYVASMIGWLIDAEQLVEWELAGETGILRRNPLQCHFVRHKSAIEHTPLRWQSGDFSFWVMAWSEQRFTLQLVFTGIYRLYIDYILWNCEWRRKWAWIASRKQYSYVRER